MKKNIIGILTFIIINISVKAQMSIDSSLVVKTCLDCNDINTNPLPFSPGSLYIEVTGGIPPFLFSLTGINPANSTPSITNSVNGITSFYNTLCKDTFRLKITDNNGDSLIFNFSTIPPLPPFLNIDSVTVKADSTNSPDSGFIKLHVSTNADSVFYKIQEQNNSLGNLGGWQDSTVFDSLPGGYYYVVFVDIYPKIIPSCGGINPGAGIFTIYVPLACENDGFAAFSLPQGACVNEPVNVQDLSNPGRGVDNFVTNIIWDFGDGNFSFTSNTMNTYVSDGLYLVHLEVYTSHGCTFHSFQPININPLPITDFSSTDNGTGLYSFIDQTTISQGAINSWLWSFDDGNSSSVQNPSHQYTAAGNYQVCLTTFSVFGCIDNFCKNISFSSVGIDENGDKNSLMIFPNPTNNNLTIVNAGFDVKELTIVDVLGKTVKTSITDKNSINVAELPNGVYFIKISSNEYSKTQRFVKN